MCYMSNERLFSSSTVQLSTDFIPNQKPSQCTIGQVIGPPGPGVPAAAA